MDKKKHTKIIKYNDSKIIMQIELSEDELGVLKLALKQYNNGYGNSLLRRINKEINNR